jgi:hypothetical protein
MVRVHQGALNKYAVCRWVSQTLGFPGFLFAPTGSYHSLWFANCIPGDPFRFILGLRGVVGNHVGRLRLMVLLREAFVENGRSQTLRPTGKVGEMDNRSAGAHASLGLIHRLSPWASRRTGLTWLRLGAHLLERVKVQLLLHEFELLMFFR